MNIIYGILCFCVWIVFLLHRESVKLIPVIVGIRANLRNTLKYLKITAMLCW
jgi:hypothetical protein